MPELQNRGSPATASATGLRAKACFSHAGAGGSSGARLQSGDSARNRRVGLPEVVLSLAGGRDSGQVRDLALRRRVGLPEVARPLVPGWYRVPLACGDAGRMGPAVPPQPASPMGLALALRLRAHTSSGASVRAAGGLGARDLADWVGLPTGPVEPATVARPGGPRGLVLGPVLPGWRGAGRGLALGSGCPPGGLPLPSGAWPMPSTGRCSACGSTRAALASAACGPARACRIRHSGGWRGPCMPSAAAGPESGTAAPKCLATLPAWRRCCYPPQLAGPWP